ncbi:MAG TPA: winged helix-turn-helix domain-containing protein [Jiangellales bacterium]|nr:winged helix-turn-helix domain-containing protein [Jiangellales bacterium]
MADLLAVRARETDMPVPKYERVASAIREQIRTGRLEPGAKLPTTQQLIAQYEVGYGSVRTALMILKAEGLIVGRPGEGVYVAG